MKSKFFGIVAILALLGVASPPVYAQTYDFSTVELPGGIAATPSGINAQGQMVGTYFSTDVVHGFLYSGGVYTTLILPYEGGMPQGINNRGQIVGYGGSVHAFLYDHGSITPIDHPSATNGTAVTGINDKGQIIGWYSIGNITHGFLYSDGIFTPLDYPRSFVQFTVPTGINNRGQIVGHYNMPAVSTGAHGFLYDNGSYTTLDHPMATNGTSASGINDKGQIAGLYTDGVAPAFRAHGFLYNNGSYTTLDDPLGTLTTVLGINIRGEIVGYYNPSGEGPHGFLATPCGAQGKPVLELDDMGQPKFAQMRVPCKN